MRLLLIIFILFLTGCYDKVYEVSDNNDPPSLRTILLERDGRKVEGSFRIPINFTATMKVQSENTKGDKRYISDGYSWTLSDPDIVTILKEGEEIKLIANKIGETNLSISYNGITSSPLRVNVTSALQISSETLEILDNQTGQISASVTFSDFSVHPVLSLVSWVLSDDTIVEISDQGQLIPLKVGTTSIQADLDGVTSNSLEFTVIPSSQELVFNKKHISLMLGETETVTVVAKYKDGSSENVTNEIEWVMDKTEIVSIDSSGTITPIKNGHVNVRGKIGESVSQDAINISVMGSDASYSVKINPRYSAIKVGSETELQTTLTLIDNSIHNVTSLATYTSSNEDVASVDSNGVVTAKSEGHTEIIANVDGVESLPTHIDVALSFDSDVIVYTAMSQSSIGGQLSPTSLSIEAGKQARFTVTANAGFTLDTIDGCGGSLSESTYITAAMSIDCTVSASFISNAANAIRSRDHRFASDAELINYAIETISEVEDYRRTLINTLYQGITEISWHPSHDSITFNSFIPERAHTVLPANKGGFGKSINRGLVMVSEDSEYRSAAMAANLFSVSTSPETDILLKNLIGWLTFGTDQKDGLSIVTAQIPSRADSHYFPSNENIRIWLTENYADSHSINEPNLCDYDKLLTCIDNLEPDLIILSGLDRQSLGYEGIAQAVAKAKSNRIPILLSNFERVASPLLSPLYKQMGLVTHSNYSSQHNAENLLVSEIQVSNKNLASIERLFTNLREGNFDTTLLGSCVANILLCNEISFFTAFKEGADWLRTLVIKLDNMGVDALSLSDASILNVSILLADKYRASIDYPIAWDEAQNWQQAMFADWIVNYARKDNLAQLDLGEYVTDKNNLAKGSYARYAHPDTISESKTLSVPYSDQWTTTGWYVLPGQTVTLNRLDNSDTEVTIKLNYHRTGTNRALQQQVYRAPLELSTQRLQLEKGKSISFSSPYGGPLYVYMTGSGETLNTEINASGVTHHPTIMNFNDESQILAFNELINNTELPHVDLRSTVAEQHMRRDRFTNAIGGDVPDVNTLLKIISEDHINTVYTLAGFKIHGKTLAESLPFDVKETCVNLIGNECVDDTIHLRRIIQHANYDQNAHCGAGCSGNPWDSSDNIGPTSWLDNHELGHNLQINRLNVQYSTVDDTDNWAGYSSRAGENSNNIFPYVVKWKAHYERDGKTTTITDDHMNHKDLFYVFMSDAAQVKDSDGNRIVLGANCKILVQGNNRYEAPWKSNNYAVHNSYRMAFYIQMALRSHGMDMADGTRLTNGFNIFTLLYQHHRIFGALSGNQTDWDAHKDRLGFSMFPFEGHSVYAGQKVGGIPGNDFMLVSLSKITGLNWQSHFDMMGLRYSSLAAMQAQNNGNKGDLQMGMYVLETELPPENMSEGLEFLPLSLSDPSTLWRDDSSPTACDL